ncbi:hypothetical protein ACFVXE_18575 [Streptomyces sp. NPDC058231]|uniref:hypothetical protein n=1 Tax=Streptomyces sp. NPDC058231 TaxID=3346392 RepID=UPI0036E6E139
MADPEGSDEAEYTDPFERGEVTAGTVALWMFLALMIMAIGVAWFTWAYANRR